MVFLFQLSTPQYYLGGFKTLGSPSVSIASELNLTVVESFAFAVKSLSKTDWGIVLKSLALTS
ncbi:hypothetical protein D3C86_2120790 [compost metagenome]